MGFACCTCCTGCNSRLTELEGTTCSSLIEARAQCNTIASILHRRTSWRVAADELVLLGIKRVLVLRSKQGASNCLRSELPTRKKIAVLQEFRCLFLCQEI
jgi:hypothetical protein